MEKKLWGQTPDGQEVYVYTLTNEVGMTASFMNFGANLLTLTVPDKDGKFDDVVLGYEELKDYFHNDPFYGCLVGRHANRIGDAHFVLNGKEYQLERNDGKNNLHSGSNGLQHQIWDVSFTANTITFSIDSPDGDEGFPGAMNIKVTYTLMTDGIRIDYEAISNEDTVFNPTNHSYFNLSGQASGSVLDHQLTLNSDQITWADSESIPNGKLMDVKGTPFDFNSPHTIGERIEEDHEELKFAKGYDHNFVLKNNGKLEKVAELYDPKTGRCMSVETDLPGIQIYSGNYMNEEEIAKGGKHFTRRGGLAMETQFFPNAINVPSFRQPVLKAGDIFRSTTIYRFGIR